MLNHVPTLNLKNAVRKEMFALENIFIICILFPDSNTLSWDQFRSFFADGVFTEEEMRKLFEDIDTHNTK